MANKYYPLNTTANAAFISSFADALVDRYGSGVEIIIRDAGNLCFHCPQISNKYVFARYNNGQLSMAYGTGYSNGLTDTVWFCSTYTTGAVSSSRLVLGESFLLLDHYKGTYSAVVLIGKTIGGVNVCASWGAEYVKSSNLVRNADTGEALQVISYNATIYHDVGMPRKTKLLIAYQMERSTDMLLTLPDGTPDTIEGLYMSFYSGATPICTATGLFSARNLCANDNAKAQLTTSLLVELN